MENKNRNKLRFHLRPWIYDLPIAMTKTGKAKVKERQAGKEMVRVSYNKTTGKKTVLLGGNLYPAGIDLMIYCIDIDDGLFEHILIFVSKSHGSLQPGVAERIWFPVGNIHFHMGAGWRDFTWNSWTPSLNLLAVMHKRSSKLGTRTVFLVIGSKSK